MDIKQAVQVLSREIETDEGYRFVWQSNIAMSFVDEFRKELAENSDVIEYETLHRIANKAASNFLNLLTKDSQ